ncbi:MAG: M20/M25/M40 family metallo-hydrolase [Fusicatenibacter sp.]|nr:M20/M25/M40 family metallo-hydrolase [Lachnospiraceae bacterium]MDY2938906.1 M20/M25/M40 family metallo-hydrolase [Fusicatenibacter sp.]
MNEVFLNQLLSCISVSGCEEMVQQAVEEEMKEYADEIRSDEMENRICVLNPKSQEKILLCAHADEIGLLITNVKADGTLQFTSRGGIVVGSYPGQQVKIKTEKGIIYGVVEAYRKIYENKELKTKDLVIDIGAKDKEDALTMVKPGDPVVLDTQIRKMANGKFTARALDDRIGVFIIMEALKRAKEKGCRAGVYAASTVAEETLSSGAYWVSSRVKPTLAVVVDVTFATDCMGENTADTGEVVLGGGPVLCNAPGIQKLLNKKMEQSAAKAGIKVQIEAARGETWTDGDRIHLSNDGVPIVLVSIPLRYMHMPCEVADEKDVEDCIELIAQFLTDYC